MSEKPKLTTDEQNAIRVKAMEKQIDEIHKQQMKQAPMCERCGSQLRNENGTCICSRFKEPEKVKEPEEE